MRHARSVATIDEVRAFARQLPRAYEALVRDRVKFRVGRIVFLAFSRDETIMGFGFPKEEREALVASEPDKFLMPGRSDLRYHWVHVRLSAIDQAEMTELVLDAWRMCVPKRVAAEYLASTPRLTSTQPVQSGSVVGSPAISSSSAASEPGARSRHASVTSSVSRPKSTAGSRNITSGHAS
jgi:hypothetical protein